MSSAEPPRGRGPETGGGAPGGPAVSFADALLPRGVVVHEALDVSARVVLPPETANGDWFDSMPLGDGRVGLVVGDVVGSGVEAGAAMAHLRGALDQALQSHPEPAGAIDELDRTARTVSWARWARVVVVVVDPQQATMSYATAGSPAPMLLRGADCWPLTSTGGAPIGAGGRKPRTATTLSFERGDRLLLYTDGLLGGRPQAGLSRLSSALLEPASGLAGVGSTPSTGTDQLCSRALTAVSDVPEDDVVVLAAEMRRVRQPSMAVQLAVRDDARRAAQQALLEWTGTLGLSEVDELALSTAVGEVVEDLVDQAHHATPGGDDSDAFAVRAVLIGPGDVEVTVADRGRWGVPPVRDLGEQDGRGLAAAVRFVDDLVVDTGPDGTRVVLHHRVERPVPLLRARGRGTDGAPDPRPSEEGFSARLEDGVLHLTGALDRRRAAEVGEAVRVASFGVDRLSVDLNDVSMLSSASVRAIDARGALRSRAPEIRLLADPDTLADQALTLMGIDHAAAS